MNTRKISVKIIIEGKDITQDIASYLTGVSWTDELEGEANTAQISLHDRERLFIADWFPKRSDTASIKLQRENWGAKGESENLDLECWEIDEIENKISTSGNTAAIKLNSIANKTDLRSVDKSRSWEKVKL